MSRLIILLTSIGIALSLARAQGAERIPFHVSNFDDDVTVSLTITSVATSPESEYDFDVTIGLTEQNKAGEIKYLDKGNHGARVDCAGRGKVVVGRSIYVPTLLPRSGDWKDHLLNTVCSSPLS